jgi:hypothetical protein
VLEDKVSTGDKYIKLSIETGSGHFAFAHFYFLQSANIKSWSSSYRLEPEAVISRLRIFT